MHVRCRFEFQARGSPHAHIILWLRGPSLFDLGQQVAKAPTSPQGQAALRAIHQIMQPITAWTPHPSNLQKANFLVDTGTDCACSSYEEASHAEGAAPVAAQQHMASQVHDVDHMTPLQLATWLQPMQHHRCSDAYCLRRKVPGAEAVCRFGFPKRCNAAGKFEYALCFCVIL